VSTIYIRHRYASQPEYDYSLPAWISRPHLAGPNKPVAIETTPENEDAKVDEVLRRANDTFGSPGVMCPPLPLPKIEKRKARR
jgi:hypothetical protein